MRKLASIQQVKEIKPIEGADRIEKIRINDWWCVSEKGNFKVGDLAVYFEIDSLMPSSNPIFNFLAKGCSEKIMTIDGREYKGYRLKTIKLRGTLSQGLALPLKAIVGTNFVDTQLVEGTDVSELLGIIKYEPPFPANLAGKVKGGFPYFLRKTDEERIQNIGELINEYRNEKFYVTEKLDGSSFTAYKHNGEFGICSRNLELLETDGNTLWEIAKKYNLKEKLPDDYAIQGEIVGEGIQKNPLKLKGQDLFVFNVYDINETRYLDFEKFITFCKELNLKTVPIVNTNYSLNGEVNVLLEHAEGNSLINLNVKREGLVFRPLQETIVMINEYPTRFSFKAVSNQYLLTNE